MEKSIKGVEVVVEGGELTNEEIQEYINKIIEDNQGEHLASLKLIVDNDYVDAEYQLADLQFERIRRITGYLVGTIDRWNDAKQAELRDRVKHTSSKF